MKKLSVVACSAFAALMFVACSDDPVTAAVPPAGGGAGQGGGVALDSTRNISVARKRLWKIQKPIWLPTMLDIMWLFRTWLELAVMKTLYSITNVYLIR